MNINIFNGYQSTVPAVIKFQQMVDIIRGDKQLAELTKRYRITHQREYKSQCYCFSVTCVFQGGKAKKDIIEVTGIGFSDFDHVPKEKLAELCAKLREDRHTLFFHITASGEGLRVLYRYGMKPCMTLEEQMKFYPERVCVVPRLQAQCLRFLRRCRPGVHPPGVSRLRATEGCPSRWRASSRPVSIPSTIPTSMPRRCICCAQASDIGLRSKKSLNSTFTTTSLRHPVWSGNSLRSTSPIPPRSSMAYS